MLSLLLFSCSEYRGGPYVSYGISVVWPFNSKTMVNNMVRELLHVADARKASQPRVAPLALAQSLLAASFCVINGTP
jgi:hypothetical protein